MKFDFDANSKSKEQCKVISKICDRMNVLRCALLNKTEKRESKTELENKYGQEHYR